MTTTKEYKDRLFSFIFGREENKEWTLSLYNAVNGSHYTDSSQIKITTIKEVLYMGMHNDVSFILANELSLYEQQSTYNPNMPVRQFLYAAKLIEQYLEPIKRKLYWKSLQKIPAPKLIVFYNGTDEHPDETLLKLSDAYPDGVKGDIEVTVRMLNINVGRNKAIFEACKPLQEYTWLVDRIRTYSKQMSREDAIDKTLAEIPDGFQLKHLLLQHKAEVKGMILTEYDEEDVMNGFREEGREEGVKEGREEGVKEGLKEGIIYTLIGLVNDKLLSIKDAANRLHLSEAEFVELMDNSVAQS